MTARHEGGRETIASVKSDSLVTGVTAHGCPFMAWSAMVSCVVRTVLGFGDAVLDLAS